MAIYSINFANKTKNIVPGSLKLGGENTQGDKIGFSNYYMEMNETPYFGICGEFHYSRYPNEQWDIELAKMKMSGINIVATYIFWNHHEETEGAFDWDGDRNLRRFVELCARNGLYVILRVGPFCHGEVRNGGLPDWLFGRSFEVRSNDEGYLAYVRKLFREIGKQADGLLFKDGGPVIGVQLENELMHAAAIWELTAKTGDEYLSGGRDGEAHMRILKDMAVEAGLVAPIYTGTGWGGAPVLEDEVLPLYGGYAYTPWSVNEANPAQRPTNEYVFRDFHNNNVTMSYFDPPYPREKYPFACCEMGGGMQTWYLARFIVDPESVAAMTVMKVAGGCNFIGYYMFHGGSNPVGRTGYLNESTTPKITYDFQAPLGEFGQVRRSNDLIRPLHYFFRHFGSHLAPMATVLPEGAAEIDPEDTETLRYAARLKGASGYMFINNYQDHVTMRDHEDVRFELRLDGETLQFPRKGITVAKNVSAILPFNFPLSDGLLLKYATAMPVTRITEEGQSTYFFAMLEGMDVEFALEGDSIADVEADNGSLESYDGRVYVNVSADRPSVIRIRHQDGTETRLCVLTSEQSGKLWEGDFRGKRRVFLSDAPILAEGDEFRLMLGERKDAEVRIYPPLPGGLRLEGAALAPATDGLFDVYSISVPEPNIPLDVNPISPHKSVIRVDDALLDKYDDILLRIGYEGNVGFAFVDGELFHDNFFNGAAWEIGLQRFRDRIAGKEIVLQATPLRRGKVTIAADAAFALQKTFTGESVAVIKSVEAVAVRYIKLF